MESKNLIAKVLVSILGMLVIGAMPLLYKWYMVTLSLQKDLGVVFICLTISVAAIVSVVAMWIPNNFK